MKLHYDAETDSLYIELNVKPGADAHEVADGVVIDVDADGNLVGIDIEYASRKLELSTLETFALPASTTKMTT